MLKTLLISGPDFVEGRHWYRRSFQANDVIVREGEHSGKIFVILSGHLQVTGSISLEGRAIRPGYQVLGPGEVFGELALVDHRPHMASVIAITSGELAEIEIETLEDCLEHNPDLAARFYRHLAQVLSARLRRTSAKMLSLLGWGLKAHGYGDL